MMKFPRTIYEGKNTRLLVLDIKRAESLYITEPHILISISEPNWEPPQLKEQRSRIATLSVYFYDCEEVIGNIYPIKDEHAKDIADFVKMYKSFKTCTTDDEFVNLLIVVHCRAGMSRSPAVAAAIAKYYDNDDKYFFENYIPNPLVYSKVLEALQS